MHTSLDFWIPVTVAQKHITHTHTLSLSLAMYFNFGSRRNVSLHLCSNRSFLLPPVIFWAGLSVEKKSWMSIMQTSVCNADKRQNNCDNQNADKCWRHYP
eukprot:307429-Pelagomonas_calceolata.AAC.6